MLKNLFENYERIVQFELMEKIEAYPYLPDDYYKEAIAQLDKDSTRICKKINSLKVDNSTQKKAEWLVHSYQQKLDDLMGSLAIYMDKLGFTVNDFVISGSWQAFIMEILESLKIAMTLLITSHSDLFYIDLEMSDLMGAFFVKETTEKLKDVLNNLQEGSACYQVYKLLLVPLEEPIDSFYYRHLFYFLALRKEIAVILQHETEDAMQAAKIRELLWRFNFNHPVYVSLIWEEYTAYLGDSLGKERVKKCLEIRKKISLNKPLYGAHLYSVETSLDKHSETWLKTEINCTRALMEAEAIIAVNPFADFKVRTNLSLNQLAGIIRIFYEKGIIFHEDRRELIRFIATHFLIASGKSFSLAALTRSYDQHKGDSILQQLKGLFEPKGS